MDRVYDTGVSATPTALPAAPETGYPIAGDPLTATPATKPGAYWFYMMTESLRRLIVAAGLTPDHTDLDLVTDAIDAKITAAIAPAASETVAGKAELATQTETNDGTDDNRIVTPLKMATARRRVLHVRDVKAAGTDGGTFTSGADRTRTLNTVVTNTITGASLSSDQVTLPVGVYDVYARAPAFDVGAHKLKLYGVTDAAVAIVGSTANTTNSAAAASKSQTDSVVIGQLTVTGSSKVFDLRHRCTTTVSTVGLGTASNLGSDEVYSEIIFKKV